MNFIENELMRKYFACEQEHKGVVAFEDCCVSRNVLTAMQEPIGIGERYLNTGGTSDSWLELTANSKFGSGYHPYQLRLPDRWQNVTCDHDQYKKVCCNCGEICDVERKLQTAPKSKLVCACYPLSGLHMEPCSCHCHKPEPEEKECRHSHCVAYGYCSGHHKPELLCNCNQGLGQSHPKHAPYVDGAFCLECGPIKCDPSRHACKTETEKCSCVEQHGAKVPNGCRVHDAPSDAVEKPPKPCHKLEGKSNCDCPCCSQRDYVEGWLDQLDNAKDRPSDPVSYWAWSKTKMQELRKYLMEKCHCEGLCIPEDK